MRALASVRTAPARLAARLQSAAIGDEGMTTAEYAVGTMTASGIAGHCFGVLRDRLCDRGNTR